MKKQKFTMAQRYAVWLHHEKRCWLCHDPLRLVEATIDHVIPETLLQDPLALQNLLQDYNLPSSFNVCGFQNWLPAHNHCNQQKSKTPLTYTPGLRIILDRLLGLAERVERTAESIKKDEKKDKTLAKLLVALDEGKVSPIDVADLLSSYSVASIASNDQTAVPDVFIRLDNGYWLHRKQIESQGECTCDRSTCLGHTSKAYCYWSIDLSEWVRQKRLYWKCYDEIVQCPRCASSHKRGDIGRTQICGRPYDDQIHQVDLYQATNL
ncbi:hypothetical protein [Azonexus sp. IMCC34839]|uniref:hypothetical protein n=1 Tax=Azonexus sp. IMCC34839 TaxID=3133695 RepID=UPI0039998391